MTARFFPSGRPSRLVSAPRLHGAQPSVVRSVHFLEFRGADPGYLAGGVVDSVLLTGNRLTYSSHDIDPACNPINIEISEDGQRIIQRHSCYGLSSVVEYTRVQR